MIKTVSKYVQRGLEVFEITPDGERVIASCLSLEGVVAVLRLLESATR